MRSTFLPEAFMECILQSLTSWSRLRAWRAGELNRICVVVDIGELCELGSQPISMGVHMADLRPDLG
jgi:hypothetical protein